MSVCNGVDTHGLFKWSYLSHIWHRGNASGRCVWCWAAWPVNRRSHNWAPILFLHSLTTAAETALIWQKHGRRELSPSLCLCSHNRQTPRGWTVNSFTFKRYCWVQPTAAWQVLKYGSKCRHVIGQRVTCVCYVRSWLVFVFSFKNKIPLLQTTHKQFRERYKRNKQTLQMRE